MSGGAENGIPSSYKITVPIGFLSDGPQVCSPCCLLPKMNILAELVLTSCGNPVLASWTGDTCFLGLDVW